MTEEVYITPQQIAARLQLTRATIYQWIKQGIIPSVRLGPRTVRVPRIEYLRWEGARTNPEQPKNTEAPEPIPA